MSNCRCSPDCILPWRRADGAGEQVEKSESEGLFSCSLSRNPPGGSAFRATGPTEGLSVPCHPRGSETSARVLEIAVVCHLTVASEVGT